jgi:hypothetical protein
VIMGHVIKTVEVMPLVVVAVTQTVNGLELSCHNLTLFLISQQ